MGEIRATVFIRANTEYATFDWLNDDRRVVGLEFDGLTIQIAGWDDRDASIVAATGALIDQLDKLRTAAAARIEAACDHCGKPTTGKELCPDCLAIWNTEPADLTSWAPGEIVAVFGR